MRPERRLKRRNGGGGFGRPGSQTMAETDSASYWIVIEGKNFKTGKPIESKRFGPYASELEAERAEPHLLPWDDQDHVYHVHIEADPKTPQSDATKDERSEGWARAAMLKSDPLILSLLRPKNGLDTGGHFRAVVPSRQGTSLMSALGEVSPRRLGASSGVVMPRAWREI